MITLKLVQHGVDVVPSHSGLSSICILKAITDNANDKGPSICSPSCDTYVISPQVGTYNIKKKNVKSLGLIVMKQILWQL